MGRTITKQVDDGVLTFEFTNNAGDVFSSFKINPTDIRMIARCEEVSRKLETIREDAPEMGTAADIAKYNDLIEEQLNYMLGYDAAKGLFIPPMTATTILPSGQIFAFLIMDTVIDLIRPELEKRQQRMESTMDKYLSKYGSD